MLKQFYTIFKKLVIFALFFRTWCFHFIFDFFFPQSSSCVIQYHVSKLKDRFQTSTRFTVWNLSLTLDGNGKLLKFLRTLVTAVYFKDRDWISKTVYCIGCSMICKTVFYSEFSDILDKTGRVTKRRRSQTIAKCYACHTHVKSLNSTNP